MILLQDIVSGHGYSRGCAGNVRLNASVRIAGRQARYPERLAPPAVDRDIVEILSHRSISRFAVKKRPVLMDGAKGSYENGSFYSAARRSPSRLRQEAKHGGIERTDGCHSVGGQDNTFDLKDLSGIHFCPNLKSLSVISMIDKVDGAATAEVSRVLLQGAVNGQVPDGDKSYIASIVSARTGISEEDARARVDTVLKQIDDAKVAAQAAADKARKAAATTALVGAISLLIGAFISSVAAAQGGDNAMKKRICSP